MADPYVLGISSGAALGATIALALPVLSLPPGVAPTALWGAATGAGLVPLCAFLGAALAATLVTTLARRGNRLPITDLLLAGFRHRGGTRRRHHLSPGDERPLAAPTAHRLHLAGRGNRRGGLGPAASAPPR